MTRALRRISRGEPLAMMCPSAMAMIRSEMLMISGMSCSITTIVSPNCAFRSASNRPSASVSR